MRAATVLLIGSDVVRARIERGGTVLWAGESAYEGLDDLPAVIRRLTAEPTFRPPTRRVRVELAHGVIQLRTLTDLPPVRASELPALVSNQASRFFRRRGGPLVIDAKHVKGRRPGGDVKAAAVEETFVEAAVAAVESAGLRVEAVVPADAGSQVCLSLLPPSVRAARRSDAGRRLGRLGLAVAATWILVGAIYLGDLLRDRRTIAEELGLLREPLALFVEARRNMRAAAEAVAQIEQTSRSRGWVTQLLASITADLPDSAYLTSFRVGRSTRSGSIEGRTTDVAAVLERMSDGPTLREPRLDEPSLHDAAGDAPGRRCRLVLGVAGGGWWEEGR